MKPVIVVHQMGKVGSSSLYAALERSGAFDAYQTHNFLSRHEPQRMHERHAHHVVNTLIPQGRSMRFISGVRDPMARNISAFFHNMPADVTTVDEALERFAVQVEQELQVTRHWFDQQVRSVLGIDVFEREADFSHGGHVVAGNFLILRLEDPQEARERAVARFLDLETFSMPRMNVGSEKPYSALYAEFKQRFRPSKALVDATFDCQYVRHFYPEAREVMKARWMERSR
jgi:hypothetical protein